MYLKGQGWSKNIINQTVPDPTNKAIWQLTTTVEASNKQFPTFENMQLYVKGNPIDVYGTFWTGLMLPLVKVMNILSNF